MSSTGAVPPGRHGPGPGRRASFKAPSEPGFDKIIQWRRSGTIATGVRCRRSRVDVLFFRFFVPHPPPPTHRSLSLRFSRLVMSIYLLSFAVSLNVNLAAPDGASNLTHLMHPSAQRAQRGENKTRKADRTNFSASIVDVFFRLHPPRGRFPGNTGHASASSEFV